MISHDQSVFKSTNPPNLPFAPRRGRVQAKRRTQGMPEIQRNTQTPFNSPLDIKGAENNLPFAPRRGRVQAKRRTQGMPGDDGQDAPHHRNNPLPQQPSPLPLGGRGLG